MILGDLRVWLLISYNVTRSLEGYDAFGVIRVKWMYTQLSWEAQPA
jgi:hypothetical protein